MGSYGTHTISNLKSATGSGKNTLSDHAPSGPGVSTKMSDFVTSKVGMPYGPQADDWKPYIELAAVSSCLSPGNTFTVRVYASVDLPASEYPSKSVTDTFYGEQILKDLVGSNLSVSNATQQSLTVGRDSNIAGNSVVYVDAQYEVNGYGKSDVDITLNDPFNDSAQHMGAQLPLSQDDTAGNNVPEVDSNNRVDLVTATPKWDTLKITYESDPSGENVEYSGSSTLHDPKNQIADTNRRYELYEVEDGDTRSKEDQTNGLADQVSWSSALIATSSSAVDGNPISEFEFRVIRISTGNTVHYVRFSVEWHDMAIGDTAIVSWNECVGPNSYSDQNGYTENISNTTL